MSSSPITVPLAGFMRGRLSRGHSHFLAELSHQGFLSSALRGCSWSVKHTLSRRFRSRFCGFRRAGRWARYGIRRNMLDRRGICDAIQLLHGGRSCHRLTNTSRRHIRDPSSRVNRPRLTIRLPVVTVLATDTHVRGQMVDEEIARHRTIVRIEDTHSIAETSHGRVVRARHESSSTTSASTMSGNNGRISRNDASMSSAETTCTCTGDPGVGPSWDTFSRASARP